MKQRLFSILLFAFSLLFPIQSYAFEHVYERKTDAIYATVRHGLAVYYDIGGDLEEYLSEYKGIKAWPEDDGWYRVEYKKKGETLTGWVTKDDFYSDCLIYDGREKQTLANGEYQVKCVNQIQTISDNPAFDVDVSLVDSFNWKFTFLGDGLYRIKNMKTRQYLQPDPLFQEKASNFWGPIETAGAYKMIRKGNYFAIKDSVTNRYLVKNMNGIIYFEQNKNACWRIKRYDKAIGDNAIRVFAQFDAEWAGYYYGPGKNEDPSSNVFCTSACGIFSTMNAIYAATGMYANPYDLASYAVKEDYRILDNGTDSGFFKAAAKKFGKKYGFSYDGSSGSIDELKQKLLDGDVAIAHVPGHYVCISTYRKNRKQFLLHDPHYLPKRATNAYGDWIDVKDLEDGNLAGSEYYFYKPYRPEE